VHSTRGERVNGGCADDGRAAEASVSKAEIVEHEHDDVRRVRRPPLTRERAAAAHSVSCRSVCALCWHILMRGQKVTVRADRDKIRCSDRAKSLGL
jgi:hypothetical protein